MKRTLLFIFTMLLIASLFSCSTVSEYYPEEIVTELSSAKYEGRLVGTIGNEKASQFLADTFKKCGIAPLFDSGYVHEYPQKVAVPTEQQPEIVITNADGTKYTLTYGDDYILNAVAEDLSVNLPLTFDIASDPTKEAVPVLSSGQRASQPEGYRILIFSYQNPRLAFTIPRPGDRLHITVTESVREKMLADGAKSVEIKVKAAVRDYTARNVVAAIKGEDGTKAIVLTAHFDHVGMQGSRIFPGALDNASGTAALLSAAVKIKKALKGKKPATDILFACVNSEEVGEQAGSTALVKKLATQYDDLYNINIDCVGGKNAGPLAIVGADKNPADLVNILYECFRKNSVAYTKDKFDASGDHNSFIGKGFGAMAIGQSGNIMEVIHNEADTVSAVDFDVIDRVAAAVSEFVLAEGAVFFDPEKRKNSAPQEFKSDDIEWMRRAYRERDVSWGIESSSTTKPCIICTTVSF